MGAEVGMASGRALGAAGASGGAAASGDDSGVVYSSTPVTLKFEDEALSDCNAIRTHSCPYLNIKYLQNLKVSETVHILASKPLKCTVLGKRSRVKNSALAMQRCEV